MELYEKIVLNDCPLCGGAGALEEENNNSFYVACYECGCQTVHVDYKTEEQKEDAAKRAAHVWNIGKVLKPMPGE
ncbi:MAG: Lar family restriction alleviation protein [Holdemanella sp.]|nr:Lar family restriction alleviation protein [Holdemanella sp.]